MSNRNDPDSFGYVKDPYRPVTGLKTSAPNVDGCGYVIDRNRSVYYNPNSENDGTLGFVLFILYGGVTLIALFPLILLKLMSGLAEFSRSVLPTAILALIISTFFVARYGTRGKVYLALLVRRISGFVVAAGLLDRHVFALIEYLNSLFPPVMDIKQYVIFTLLLAARIALYIYLFPFVFLCLSKLKKLVVEH